MKNFNGNFMRKLFIQKVMKTSVFITLLILGSFFFAACSDDDTTPSLYDSGKSSGAAPEITSIFPADSALAGISEITLTGANFSATKEENIVYFNGKVAQVLDATATTIKVKAPNIIADTVNIKVAVYKVVALSNNFMYKLKAAVEQVYAFKDYEVPYGITTDRDENLYMSFKSQSGTGGFQILNKKGELSKWAPAMGGEVAHYTLRYYKGDIYSTRLEKRIIKTVYNTTPATYRAVPSAVTDFDFDKDGNIWAGTKGAGIFRIDNNNTNVKTFAFTGIVKSVRIFEEKPLDLYLYVAAAEEIDGVTYEVIKRAKIYSADSLGSFELYFNMSEKFGSENPSLSVNAITFAADGDMVVGTNMEDPVIIVHTDKSYETLYPGLISSDVLSFAWGPGNNLYYTRGTVSSSQVVIRIDMQKTGAPYYGRD